MQALHWTRSHKLHESGAQVGVGCVSSGFFVPTMFSGLLGFSAHVSITPAPAAVSVTPAPAVIAAPASVVVHRATVCRVIRGTRVLVWKIEESIEARYQASLKRRRIQIKNHTPRIRAISHGMKLRPFTWLRELCRNSRCSKSSRATRLMEDVRGETCQQPSIMCGILQVESTATQIIPR